MSDLATYLAGLKAGDVVTARNCYHRSQLQDFTVTKRTPQQIICGKHKWWVTGGRGFGDAYSLVLLHPDEAVEERAHPGRAALLAGIREEITSRPLTLSTIPAMRAALDRAEAALREGEQ